MTHRGSSSPISTIVTTVFTGTPLGHLGYVGMCLNLEKLVWALLLLLISAKSQLYTATFPHLLFHAPTMSYAGAQ